MASGYCIGQSKYDYFHQKVLLSYIEGSLLGLFSSVGSDKLVMIEYLLVRTE